MRGTVIETEIEKSYKKGIKQGIEQGIQLVKEIYRLNSQGYSMTEIAEKLSLDIEQVEEILED